MSEQNNIEPKKVCGIVMPISPIDGCSETHWSEMYEIIKEAIRDAGFEGNLVSYADDVGIIQKTIIHNLYNNQIVVCDVSGKNPNVMFELGMRLAFDKPTIIIKDDKTSYSFDTSPIEHLEYPRDLRFSKIIEFKRKLTSKIKATAQNSSDAAYSPFLKHFGDFKVAKIDQKEVSGQEFIIDEIKGIKLMLARLHQSEFRQKFPMRTKTLREEKEGSLDFCLKGVSFKDIESICSELKFSSMVEDYSIYHLNDEHPHISIELKSNVDAAEFESFFKTLINSQRRSVRLATAKKRPQSLDSKE